jgi:hypothetical protein
VTNKPSSKSEKVATVDEVTEAIGKLRPEDWAKLAAFADNRARFMSLYGAAVDGGDVMQRAIVELLETRRTWNPKKATFVGVLFGAMKSIASNNEAKSLRNGYSVSDSQLAGGVDEEDQGQTPLELAADTRLNAELQMQAMEGETEARLFVAGIYGFFESDAEAQLVMNGWLEGKSGPDIMADLSIDRRAYETISKRIRRKSTARWSKGSSYVSH